MNPQSQNGEGGLFESLNLLRRGAGVKGGGHIIVFMEHSGQLPTMLGSEDYTFPRTSFGIMLIITKYKPPSSQTFPCKKKLY